jgi:hypothetical protein
LTFNEVSQYKLCYQFAGEAYRLFPKYTVSVKTIYNVSMSELVVGVPATVGSGGAGRGALDTVSFRSSNSQDCNGPDTSGVGVVAIGSGSSSITFTAAGDYLVCYTFAGAQTVPFKVCR